MKFIRAPVLAATKYGSFNTKYGAVNCRLGAKWPGGRRGSAYATTYWTSVPKQARVNVRLYIKNHPNSAFERKGSHTTKPGKKQAYVEAAGGQVNKFKSIHSFIPAGSGTQIEKVELLDSNPYW
ncbi:hypothetical protein [Anaerosalibacter bizertensis]|uniref:hypothetical protein n=1 Tax=Anaerosalibacter bizertensis TaxID=932217 RepID=UPI003512FC42